MAWTQPHPSAERTYGPLPPPARDGAEAGWGAALEKLADSLES